MSELPSLTSPLVAESWCHTNVLVKNFSFKWTINNFSYCREKCGEKLKSSTFPAYSSTDELKWKLLLYPRGVDDSYADCLSLFLYLDSCRTPEVTVMAEFSLLNSEQEKIKSKKLSQPKTLSQGKDVGYKKFVHLSFLSDEADSLLPNDRLTFFCEVTVAVDACSISGRNSAAIHFKVPECQLSDDFGDLFLSRRLSDVTLVSNNGQEFAAHKTILAARSPVFAAMFELDMKEKDQSRVEIEEMEPQVLEGMLRFLYTGKASDVMVMPEDLLVAAERYALNRLKLMCEEHLCSNLTTVRAAEVLIIADQYRADRLKASVIGYIQTAAKDVMMTEGWKYLIKTHPHLIAEVFDAPESRKLHFS